MRKEFRNYVQAKEERPYHRVIIPRENFETEELAEPLMIWTVHPFVWTCSPYFTLRMLSRALELCIGDHPDTNNPFNWYHVQFNLPCTTRYDPSLPLVGIIRFYGELFGIVVVLFDDGRVYGIGAERVRSGLSSCFI